MSYEPIRNIGLLKFCTVTAFLLTVLIIIGLVYCGLALADDTAIETIAYEASNQSMQGKIMVASVIKTRMKARSKSAKVICKQAYQFSCWDPNTGAPTQWRRLTGKEINDAKSAWAMATAGEFNHYARFDCKPYWIKSAKKSLRVGDHVFYKL